MGKSVAFHNLGCKVNSYEMEIMMKELAKNGYLIVPFDQKADVYIINTCSVTNIADRKSRQMIHRAKSSNPDAVIVAAGCYVDTHGDKDTKTEGVDICVVNAEKKDIAGILNRYFDANSLSCVSGSIPSDNNTGLEEGLHTRCFIKVQDGCDQFCSYCIIPYARGRIRSRSIREVTDEIKRYVQEGYREFVPTGIHISSYGKDRPEEGEDLSELIGRISEIENVRRIRLSSLEPNIITRGFAGKLSGIGQICPHFHLSLQSGSDEVLKRMNRHYTTDEYARAVDILREHFDDPAITTDIITGFPGETEEEFEETMAFVDRMDFYETHVFKYSRRKGTVADRMSGQITEAVKHDRSSQLLDLNKKKKRAFEDKHIQTGKLSEVLFEDIEEIMGRQSRTGYTREYIKVYDGNGEYGAGDIAKGILKRHGNAVIFEGI